MFTRRNPCYPNKYLKYPEGSLNTLKSCGKKTTRDAFLPVKRTAGNLSNNYAATHENKVSKVKPKLSVESASTRETEKESV